MAANCRVFSQATADLRMNQSVPLPGRNLGVVCTEGSFRKGMRVPFGVPGGGVLGQVQVGGGEVFCLWEMMEKGKGVGK